MIIARINIAGKTAHGSLPWRGESSLTNLLNSLEKLKNMLSNMSVKIPEPLREAYNNSQRIFGEDTIKITISVGVLSSGTVPTMVPDHSTAKLDIRIPHGVDINYVSELIREMGFEVEFSTEPNYYLGKWEELFLKSAREVGKNLVEVIDPADNDGRLFRARNIPSLCYGPGNEFNSHVYNEFVEESELENTLNVYTHFIRVLSVKLTDRLKKSADSMNRNLVPLWLFADKDIMRWREPNSSPSHGYLWVIPQNSKDGIIYNVTWEIFRLS